MNTAATRMTDAISAAMVEIYGGVYDHDRTTATTHINGKVVVCILEDILSVEESAQVTNGNSSSVIDARVAFQKRTEDEFTRMIERLTGREVTAFLSANQTDPGIASEMFFLDSAPGEESR